MKHEDRQVGQWKGPKLLVLVFCILIWEASAEQAPSNHHSFGDCLLEEWVIAAADFVIAATGAARTEVCVELRTKEQLRATFLQGHASLPSGSLAAIYDPARNRISISDDLATGDIMARSYLVHEFVHAHQFASGQHLRVRCLGQLEGDAYAIQARYLDQHGLKKEAMLFRLMGMLQGACDSAH